jgi:hypothetical protein
MVLFLPVCSDLDILKRHIITHLYNTNQRNCSLVDRSVCSGPEHTLLFNRLLQLMHVKHTILHIHSSL